MLSISALSHIANSAPMPVLVPVPSAPARKRMDSKRTPEAKAATKARRTARALKYTTTR